MDEDKRKRLEAAGYVVGDFEQFATEVLGMSLVEARETQFRADLGSAIHKLRQERGLTQVAFGKLVGLNRTEVSRLEIGDPDLSLDIMLRAYLTAGGLVRYEFESPATFVEVTSEVATKEAVTSKAASPPARRKATKAVKA